MNSQYLDFTLFDFNHDKILENYPLHDKNLSKFFEKDSDLAPEMSPVFFNAAVLNKYKGTKNLKLETDANESGQVYVYAYYLSQLSYTEQGHWLQYNEWPKENSTEYIKNMSENFSKFKSFDEFDLKLARFITKRSILANFHGIPDFK